MQCELFFSEGGEFVEQLVLGHVRHCELFCPLAWLGCLRSIHSLGVEVGRSRNTRLLDGSVGDLSDGSFHTDFNFN